MVDNSRAGIARGDWQSRWLPNLHDLLRINGDDSPFIGEGLSPADTAVRDVLNAILDNIQDASPDGHPAPAAFYVSVAGRPEVAADICG